jgi:hypothetical protein
MELKQADNLSYADQILDGLKELNQLLENPNIEPVPASVFIVMEVACEKARDLVRETMQTDTRMGEKTEVKK